MTRRYIIPTLLMFLVCACGGHKQEDGATATNSKAQQEATDTASVRRNAIIMANDMQERCKDNDIETLAALAQEATDNISYSLANGDKQSAEIYAAEIRRFINANAATIGDMASQNYVIKQLVTTIVNMHSSTNDNATDTLLHHISSPISSALPGE